MLKNVSKGYRKTHHFQWSEKKLSPRQGGEISQNKIEFKNFLDSVFLQAISPPCLGLVFFFKTTKNEKFSLYPFLTFFSPRVLETHLRGLKAACIGPALSKFRPSVGDGAT